MASVRFAEDRSWAASTLPSFVGKSKSLRALLPRRSGGGAAATGDDDDGAARSDAPGRRGGVEPRDPPEAGGPGPGSLPRPPAASATAPSSADAVSGYNDKGNEFFGRGAYDAALRMYGEALRLLRSDAPLEGGGPAAASPALRRCLTARCLANVGAVHIRRGEHDAAATALEQAVRQASLVLSRGSGAHYRRSREVFADGTEHLGLVAFRRGELDQADALYAQALQARRQCLDLLDRKARPWPRGGLGRAGEAARALAREERGAALLDLSVTLLYVALLREKQGRPADAVARVEEALRKRRDVIPDARDDPQTLHLCATAGRLYCHDEVARHRDALGCFHEVHRLQCDRHGRDHLAVVPSLNRIALLYHRLGEHEKCVALADQAVDIAAAGRGLNQETVDAYAHRAAAQSALGDHDRAAASYAAALAAQDRLCLPPDDPRHAALRERLAAAHRAAGDRDRAADVQADALAAWRRSAGPDDVRTARACATLGDDHAARGDAAAAVRAHTRALRIFKHKVGESGGGGGGGEDDEHARDIAVAHNRIAAVLKGDGDRHRAMEHYVAALRHAREARLPSTDPVVADTIKNVVAFQKC